jgi:hypothetical protein
LNNKGQDYFNYYPDLLATPDGNLITAGGLYDTISTAQIRKFSPDGDTIFTRGYKSILYPEQDYLVVLEIRQRHNGGYAVLISYTADDNPFDVNISLLLVDSNFQVEHYKPYGTGMREISNSLIVDSDGGYLIGAKRTNEGETLINYSCRTLIIKTDSAGEVVWQYLSPSNVLRDAARAMIKTPDGGLVVASGIGTEYGNNPNFHVLVWDALIFKLDADRNVVWSTPFRSYAYVNHLFGAVSEMVEAPDGSGYVACGIAADSTEGLDEPYYDSWIFKVSPEGDSLWARHYAWFDGQFVAPEAYDLKATPDGGYVLVGTTLNLGVHAPGWIMKLDEHGCLVPGCHLTDAAEEEAVPEIGLAIYPNPTTDYLNFYLKNAPQGKEASFRIVDANGRSVSGFNGSAANTTFIVPVWDWPAGVYFLQYLEDGVVRVTERFVKG